MVEIACLSRAIGGASPVCEPRFADDESNLGGAVAAVAASRLTESSGQPAASGFL